MDDFINTIFAAAVVFWLYFAPSAVAFIRKVPSAWSIVVLNLFLGWTLIGWVVALAMAVRTVPPKPTTG